MQWIVLLITIIASYLSFSFAIGTQDAEPRRGKLTCCSSCLLFLHKAVVGVIVTF